MRRLRTICLLLLTALAAFEPLAAPPVKPLQGPIRILVPVHAGGTSDIAARVVAEGIRPAFAQPVIVENRPGAAGRIAADALRHVAADGTSLLMAPIAMAIFAPLVSRHPGFDVARDFAPVAQVARFQYALAVGPRHPARTVAEFVAWAQAHPGQASFGTPGAGSVPHFFGALVSRDTGAAMVHVAYNGAPALAVALMADHIPCGISTLPDLIEQHRAGLLRIIATSGSERSPALASVPTFREQGFGGIEGVGWTGLYAPAGTPKPVIDRLAAAVADAMRTPAARQSLLRLGLEPSATGPEELAAIMKSDTTRWSPIVKASGFVGE